MLSRIKPKDVVYPGPKAAGEFPNDKIALKLHAPIQVLVPDIIDPHTCLSYPNLLSMHLIPGHCVTDFFDFVGHSGELCKVYGVVMEADTIKKRPCAILQCLFKKAPFTMCPIIIGQATEENQSLRV